MKKINYILATVLLLMTISIYSCDTVSNAETTYTGSIQGWVYDDSTKLPINSVKITAAQINDTLYTDLTGMFKFNNFAMPRGEYNYYIISSKAGYINNTTYVSAKSDITTTVDSILLVRIH